MKCVPIHPKQMPNQGKLTSTLYANIAYNAGSNFMASVDKHLQQPRTAECAHAVELTIYQSVGLPYTQECLTNPNQKVNLTPISSTLEALTHLLDETRL